MIGTTLSHYRILEKLGQGAMAVVYRGEDARPNGELGLIVLPPLSSVIPEERRGFGR